MKLAYIAGPYRAETTQGIITNIMKARAVAVKYWQLGYSVICPHMNTALFDGLAPDTVWLEGDFEMLKRCDVIVMLPEYTKSKGALQELEVAKEAGLDIIFEPEIISSITQYQHHGAWVSVQSDLKGKHREHCLCYQGCKKFKPGEPDNCYIAEAILKNCVKFDLVTPVWECPGYDTEELDDASDST
jgi:hypothetical protein